VIEIEIGPTLSEWLHLLLAGFAAWRAIGFVGHALHDESMVRVRARNGERQR